MTGSITISAKFRKQFEEDMFGAKKPRKVKEKLVYDRKANVQIKTIGVNFAQLKLVPLRFKNPGTGDAVFYLSIKDPHASLLARPELTLVSDEKEWKSYTQGYDGFEEPKKWDCVTPNRQYAKGLQERQKLNQDTVEYAENRYEIMLEAGEAGLDEVLPD